MGSARQSKHEQDQGRNQAPHERVIPISDRPLYTSFAWAYDLVVPSPAPPQPDEVARLFAGRRTIVDVGCGTGRHAASLAERGFSVLGIDASAEMLEVAQARGSNATFEVGDLFSWRPRSPVDGVLCRGVLNDFLQEKDRQRALDSLFSMLRVGGLLVLSLREIEKTRVRYGREPVVTRSEEGVFFRAEARFLGDTVVIEETISSEDARADYRFEMKPWSLTEVDERTAAAGFTRVERRIEGDRIVALCVV
ncbi:MAG TPA: class I SAM-dependent methyltransferase [Thermoleophilaceae bacterium]